MTRRPTSGDQLTDELFELVRASGVANPSAVRRCAVLAAATRVIESEKLSSVELFSLAVLVLERAANALAPPERRLVAFALNLPSADLPRSSNLTSRIAKSGTPKRTFYRRLDESVPELAESIRELERQISSTLDPASPTVTAIVENEAEARAESIAVLAPLSSWPTDYYYNLIRGIGRAFESTGGDQNNLIIMDLPIRDASEAIKARLTSQVLSTICGLIALNTSLPDEAKNSLADREIPAVSIMHEDNAAPFVASVIPRHTGFRSLIEDTLRSRRCDAAVMITKELRNDYKEKTVDPYRLEKRNHFSAVVAQAGLIARDPLRFGSHLERIGVAAGEAMVLEIASYDRSIGNTLDRVLSVPPYTALVCMADLVAAGVAEQWHKQGTSAREKQIRLLGFDNSPESKIWDLSTVDYNLEAMASLAVQQLKMAMQYPRTVEPVTLAVTDRPVIRSSSSW